MKAFVALLRRELWEHRSLLIVPAVLATLIVGSTLSSGIYSLMRDAEVRIEMNGHMLSALAGPHNGQYIPALYVLMLICFGVVLAVNVLLYLLDCLYADRRDRSILFWKSLPVSDSATVLSKLATGLLVAPAIAIAAAFATTLVLAIAGTVILWISGIAGSSSLWELRPLLVATVGAPLVTLLLVLWYAPVAAWCLLASAWAPRAPMLWAVLPPVGLIVIEAVALRTHWVPVFLGDRLGGVFQRLFDTYGYTGFGIRDGGFVGNMPALQNVYAYLGSSDLWGGVFTAVIFTAAAIALRRYRDET